MKFRHSPSLRTVKVQKLPIWIGSTTTVVTKNNPHPRHKTNSNPNSQKGNRLRMTRKTRIPNNPKTALAQMITEAK